MSRKKFNFAIGAVFAKNTKVRQILLIEVDENGEAYLIWRPIGEGPVREEARYDCMPITFHRWAQVDVSDFWPTEVASVLDGSFRDAVEIEIDEDDEDDDPYDEDYLK